MYGNHPPSDDDDDDSYLKDMPKGFTPSVEDESSAFRSLNLSENEEEEDEDFLRKTAAGTIDQFVPEVKNESYEFRSIGDLSEDEETSDKTDEAETKPIKNDGRYLKPPPGPFLTTPSSSNISEPEKSVGISLYYDCQCCKCCPYHDQAQRIVSQPETAEKKKSSSKRSSRRDQKRTKSRDKAKTTSKMGNARVRPSQIMGRLFSSLLPQGEDDERLAVVCSGFADALFHSGAITKDEDDTVEE